MTDSSEESTEKTFTDLPYDCLFQIFGYMSYHEVAQCRLICRHANAVCHAVLSSGAERLRLKLSRLQARLKSQLPRRESARRGHVASDLLEVVNSVENRVSIIRLALDRYLITGQLTFFPGKVLDEALRILNQIEALVSSQEGEPLLTPFSAIQKVTMLRDLRDLSTMASEHIDDVILPNLRNRHVDPLVKRFIPGRPQEIGFGSPEKPSTSSVVFQSPTLSSNSASTNSNEGASASHGDPMIRLCGLFFEQFRNMSEHLSDMKNKQKQSDTKISQLTGEVNTLKQQRAQDHLAIEAVAKKLEMTETALADMRRLTMNANNTNSMPHICEEAAAPMPRKRRTTSEMEKDGQKVSKEEASPKRRVTRASSKATG